VLAALLVAFANLPALAEGRLALVIGNGAYRSFPVLANPPNDAEDLAAALKSLGFKVTLGIDLDQAGMQAQSPISRFRRRTPTSRCCTTQDTASSSPDETTSSPSARSCATLAT